MITKQNVYEILYKSLDQKEKEQLNLIGFVLIKMGIKRKIVNSSKLISYIKEFNNNKE